MINYKIVIYVAVVYLLRAYKCVIFEFHDFYTQKNGPLKNLLFFCLELYTVSKIKSWNILRQISYKQNIFLILKTYYDIVLF